MNVVEGLSKIELKVFIELGFMVFNEDFRKSGFVGLG